MIRFERPKAARRLAPRDGAANQHAEEELSLLIDIALSANAAGDVDAAVRLVLDKLCKATGWDCGQVWVPNAGAQALECRPHGYGHGRDLRAFREISQRTSMPLGTGLPGRCCCTKQAIWLCGAAVDDGDPRRRCAGEAGLKTGTVVPVLDQGELPAVLEFCAFDKRPESERVVNLMLAAAAQLSTIIRCRQAEARADALGLFGDEQKRRIQAHRDALARANKEIEQLGYAAAHDLQGPVRKILGYTQLLSDACQDRLGVEAEDCVRSVVRAAHHMGALVQDLLAYSRVLTRRSEPTSVELDGTWRTVVGDLKTVIDTSGAVVTSDPLPVVIGDEGQLARLLGCLLDNALKFRSPAPPRIHLAAQRLGGEWVFSLRDNGIGIDPKFAERIFVIFQKLHGHEAYPGTGAGLAISKKIVERHGGRIWCDSRPGEGATLHFTLPGGAL